MKKRILKLSVLLDSDSDCDRCVERLKGLLARIRGVSLAKIDPSSRTVAVTYDPQAVTMDTLDSLAREAGVTISTRFAHKRWAVTGLDCPDCASKIEKNVSLVDGVFWVGVSLPLSILEVEYDREKTREEEIVSRVRRLGYGLRDKKKEVQPGHRRWVPISISGMFLLLGFISHHMGNLWLSGSLFLVSVLISGLPTVRKAFYSLLSRSPDVSLLMSISAVGAGAIGEWPEGATVLFLFSLGNRLQFYTMEKTRHAIKSLVEASPDEAMVEIDGALVRKPVRDLLPGDTALVRPGDKIPADGEIASGSSYINESTITGEATPREKRAGDEVYAGTINEGNPIRIIVRKKSKDSRVARIVTLVEEAQLRKAPSQSFIESFSRYYTPSVVLVSLLVFAVPVLAMGGEVREWLYRALTILVISCPCALVISIPVAVLAAIGNASRNGILIKGGVFLEELGRAKVFAFDKTGTITRGTSAFCSLDAFGRSEDDALALAASLEKESTHTVAKAILHEARHRKIEFRKTFDPVSYPGRGVSATIDGERFYLGKEELLDSAGICFDASPFHLSGTERKENLVFLGSSGKLVAVFFLSDRPREEAKTAVGALSAMNAARTVLLSGDTAENTASAGSEIGVSESVGNLKPEDKVEIIERLRKEIGPVVMVGDGINDAPGLAAANVGIAMGGAGTDVALETADIVLATDDLMKIPYAFSLSKKTKRVVLQNVVFSITIKLLFLLMAFPGFLTLWVAVLGDVGSSLLVTLNGMRLLGPGDTDGKTPLQKATRV
ncbi:MAG: heavy metal translocating P-type ATPase [Candidatus Eisenbacteria bacterium]|nr:heavy metal translocating P-type ATPase [Candidatus Eisenbacteria bacterium]